MRNDRWYLIVAAVVPYSADIALTLAGQSPRYWSGEFERTSEWNLVGESFLSIGPAAFIGGAAFYALAFSAAIYWLPKSIAWWLSIGYFLAHVGGAKSWIPMFDSPASFTFWDGALNTIAAALGAFCYLRAAKEVA